MQELMHFTVDGEVSFNFELVSYDERPESYCPSYTIKTIRVEWNQSDRAFLHVFINTTYLKKLEEAKSINKCLHIMFSSISHEFRTPINAFSNALALLKVNNDKMVSQFDKIKGITDQERSRIASLLETNNKYVKIGDVSSKFLLNLTEDILDFAKIEAGMFRLNEMPFKIKDLIEELEYIFDLQ